MQHHIAVVIVRRIIGKGDISWCKRNYLYPEPKLQITCYVFMRSVARTPHPISKPYEQELVDFIRPACCGQSVAALAFEGNTSASGSEGSVPSVAEVPAIRQNEHQLFVE